MSFAQGKDSEFLWVDDGQIENLKIRQIVILNF